MNFARFGEPAHLALPLRLWPASCQTSFAMLIPEAVRSSYLFKGLRPDQIDSVLALAQEKMFTGGEILVRQFDQSQDLLVILSGEVRVKGFQGEDLATLGAGSVLGEISLV